MRSRILSENYKPRPFWWDSASPDDHAGDELPEATEILVVGSGYAGLCRAIELASMGLDACVIDAGAIGRGASTRNAGFLSGRTGVSKQIDLEALVALQISAPTDGAGCSAVGIMASRSRDSEIPKRSKKPG